MRLTRCLTAALALQVSSVGYLEAASETQEAMWLDRFVALSEDPHTSEAAPEEVETMFGLQKDKALGPCYSRLKLSGSHPPFITGASADLTGPPYDCKSLRIGLVAFDIKSGPGFVATVLDRITADTHVQPSEIPAGQNITYHWQLAPGTAIEFTVYGTPKTWGRYGITLAQVPVQLTRRPP